MSGQTTVTVNPSSAQTNVQPIVVDAGPPQLETPSTNVAFTTVKVCVPGTTTCQSIDHVMVDTGSSGLRLLSGASGGELSILLPQENDSNGNPLDECLVFLDGYVWGNVATADIYVGGSNNLGEKAASVPVQVIIPSSSSPAVPSSCSSQNPSGGAGNEGNSVEDFGANGLIGVGLFQQDCGAYCVSQGSSCNSSMNNPCVYYDCPSSGCTPDNVTLLQQVPNPVAAFATDNNGVLIQLPSVPDGGSSPVGGPYLTGSMIFGIGTESNNGLGSAQVYDVPDSGSNAGNFTTSFNNNTYPGFVDSGSNAYFFADSSIPTCPSPNQVWYCPTTSPMSLSAANQGTNMSSPVTADFKIENADNLFNSSNTAFSTLGGTFTGTPIDFDWGLSFFYGKNVFTAIDGAITPGGTGPYFAF